jgi:hypothetical protein
MFGFLQDYQLLNAFKRLIYLVGLVNKKNGQAADRSPDLSGIRLTNIPLYHDSVNNADGRSAIL